MVLVLADEEAREKVAQGARQVWRVLLCEKADGNFLGELFCTKLGETRICLGTYPSQDSDIIRLR